MLGSGSLKKAMDETSKSVGGGGETQAAKAKAEKEGREKEKTFAEKFTEGIGNKFAGK